MKSLVFTAAATCSGEPLDAVIGECYANLACVKRRYGDYSTLSTAQLPVKQIEDTFDSAARVPFMKDGFIRLR